MCKGSRNVCLLYLLNVTRKKTDLICQGCVSLLPVTREGTLSIQTIAVSHTQGYASDVSQSEEAKHNRVLRKSPS